MHRKGHAPSTPLPLHSLQSWNSHGLFGTDKASPTKQTLAFLCSAWLVNSCQQDSSSQTYPAACDFFHFLQPAFLVAGFLLLLQLSHVYTSSDSTLLHQPSCKYNHTTRKPMWGKGWGPRGVRLGGNFRWKTSGLRLPEAPCALPALVWERTAEGDAHSGIFGILGNSQTWTTPPAHFYYLPQRICFGGSLRKQIFTFHLICKVPPL